MGERTDRYVVLSLPGRESWVRELFVPGEAVWVPIPWVPVTLGQLAERAVEEAQASLECAQVELNGARERLRMIREAGLADSPFG